MPSSLTGRKPRIVWYEALADWNRLRAEKATDAGDKARRLGVAKHCEGMAELLRRKETGELT